MSDTPLWQLSASDIVEQTIARQTTTTAVVAAILERVKLVNPDINAIVDDLSDEAMAQAEAHESTLRTHGPIGPLHGVPVTIKENVDQKGRATPNGVSAFTNVIAPDDSPLVRNLKAAGAIVIGRTNTPEFSFRATTDNALHGRTYNPWNDWASAGGSSGGAAAAVMSGMGPIAHGNDIGGSLRYPSAATGATTVKPGLGRTPAYNPSAMVERGMLAQIMSVQGLIAREVRDIRRGMQCLIAYDPHDPWMVPAPFQGVTTTAPIKVAFTTNTFDFTLDPAVEKALYTARDALADAGYTIVEAEPPAVDEIATEAWRCLYGEMSVLLKPDIEKYGSAEIKKIFHDYFEMFPPYDGDQLIRGMAKRADYTRRWLLFLQSYPLVLTPFLPTPTYAHARDTDGAEGVREILGAGHYSVAMNFMGLPAGTIAASENDGLPISVQIVGRRFREDMILDACEAIEDRVGVMAHKLFARNI